MTAAISPRFMPRLADKDDQICCDGIHHTDFARCGTCLTCGVEIVKRADGRMYDIRHTVSESGFEHTAYRCYERTHACEPAQAETFQAAHQRDLAAGAIVHDQHVTVVRGRKVPKGTAGIVFYTATAVNHYTGEEYMRVGFKADDGEAHFVPSDYLRAGSPS